MRYLSPHLFIRLDASIYPRNPGGVDAAGELETVLVSRLEPYLYRTAEGTRCSRVHI